jgi:hypothetical protein
MKGDQIGRLFTSDYVFWKLQVSQFGHPSSVSDNQSLVLIIMELRFQVRAFKLGRSVTKTFFYIWQTSWLRSGFGLEIVERVSRTGLWLLKTDQNMLIQYKNWSKPVDLMQKLIKTCWSEAKTDQNLLIWSKNWSKPVDPKACRPNPKLPATTHANLWPSVPPGGQYYKTVSAVIYGSNNTTRSNLPVYVCINLGTYMALKNLAANIVFGL